MPWGRYVLGYHGCDAGLARKIAAGEDKLRPSQNDYDWLGHGHYFWEDSAERAFLWAKAESEKSGSPVKRPGILGAIIDLGNCLNLIEVEYLNLVSAAYGELTEFLEKLELPMPKNTGLDFRARRLDCAVFEALHKFREVDSYPPFETVRAFFVEGEPLYPTAGIRQLDHVQICVRNHENIVGYFLPQWIDSGPQYAHAAIELRLKRAATLPVAGAKPRYANFQIVELLKSPSQSPIW